MARRMFNGEQVRRMAENPYTLHVSTTQITFTKAFKEEFWRRYQDGDTPRQILYDLGYEPEVLGRNRLSGIQNVICKQAASGEAFHEGTIRKNDADSADDDTTRSQLRRMQHQIRYLEQEVEYLKKISSARDIKRRGQQP